MYCNHKNENILIDDDSLIYVKCLKIGKFVEKSFKYKNIKYKLKVELLFLI